jgi:squalene-associated FAD-dependent desaturase
MTLPQSHRNVVVIGGGLAGISAAIELAEAGLQVTVLEARPWLGGATFSFARRGLTIDNGQHMFLRSCTAYRDLLAKLGMADSAPLQDSLDLTVLGQDGQVRLRRSALPAPLHLARSLARYQLLSVPERIKVAAAVMALQFADFRNGEASFGDWLSRKFQDARARQLFWDLLSVSALNAGSGQADPATAAAAIRTALLATRRGADLGLPAVPLSRLHGAAATGLLAKHGAIIRLGVKVVSVQSDPAGGYQIRLGAVAAADGKPAWLEPTLVTADAVVMAVPAWEAADLAPAELGTEAARWATLEPSPVVSLHVLYGSRVTRLPVAAIVGPQVLWVADKTAAAGLHTGQYLAVSIPAADAYVDTPAAALREEFLEVLSRHFPAAATAGVEDFFVTRERRATIRQSPGSAAMRPRQPDGLPGLALAGAWTDTGWPDTMEGAVRSGHGAARKIIADLRPGAVVTGPARHGAAAAAPVSAPPPAPVPEPRVGAHATTTSRP